MFGGKGAAHNTLQQGPLRSCMPPSMGRQQCFGAAQHGRHRKTHGTQKDACEPSPSVLRTKTLRGQEMQQVRGQHGSQKHGAAQGRSITKLSPLNLSCRQVVSSRETNRHSRAIHSPRCLGHDFACRHRRRLGDLKLGIQGKHRDSQCSV